MADENTRMSNYLAEDIVDNIEEVREARGTFDTLDDRLDNIEGGSPSPSSDTPAMDGTGAAGTADTYARGDHVHPTDTSRQAAIDSEHPIDGTEVRLGTYSKATTKQDIAENDTIKTALGKVEKRIEDNENNIAYNANMGVKNLSRWSGGTASQDYPTMASQIPFTSDGGEYTISYNTALTTGTIAVGFKDSNGNATATVEIGNASKIKTVTIPANTAYFNIYTLAYGNYTNFMICKKAVYDSDPTYQPHALSNAELTADMSEVQTGLGAVCVFRTIKSASATYTYTMTMDDFRVSPSIANCGTYLVSIVSWSTTPTYSLYAVSYSGGNITDYNVVQKIAGTDAAVTCTNGVISVTSSGKVQIFALR